jgi:hypothetical protein
MTVHIIKLCVGADSVEDLQTWVDRRVAERKRARQPPVSHHDTRMWPKRSDEVLDGGSLYWVIRGVVQVRQQIVALEEIADADGKAMCRMMLDPQLVRTEPRGRRPFQGWRYLTAEDAPPDLKGDAGDMSPELAAALKGALAW